MFFFPLPIQSEYVIPSCSSPSDVSKYFCNESDVRGPAGILCEDMRHSKSNLTVRPKIQSVAGNSRSQSQARCVSFSSRLNPACLSYLLSSYAEADKESSALQSSVMSLHLCCFFMNLCMIMSNCFFFFWLLRSPVIIPAPAVIVAPN